MSDLLDDYQHQNYQFNQDKNLIKFEGMVPHALLSGTTVAVICIALDQANIVYGIENPSIQGNANSGITSSSHQLDVLLHIREADKAAVDQILDQYDEIDEPTDQSRSALSFFGWMVLGLLGIILALSLLM
ncbi:MAG: hypothetical protein AB8E82_18070 [Aureispira sp.]